MSITVQNYVETIQNALRHYPLFPTLALQLIPPVKGASPILDPNVIMVYYTFNNNLQDDSGHGGNATVHGTTAYAAGFIGNGFSRNATTYLTNANNSLYDFETTDAFWIQYWTNLANTGLQRSIADKFTGGKGFRLLNIANQHQFVLAGATGSLVMTMTAGITGNHLVQWAYDGTGVPSGVKCFVDGASKALTTTTNALAGTMKNGTNLTIGALNDGTAPLGACVVDEFILAKGAFSSSDATYLWNGGSGHQLITVKITNETVQISEASVLIKKGKFLMMNETEQLTEAKIKHESFVRLINELQNISEAKTIHRTLVRLKNETVNIIENRLIHRGLVRLKNETVQILEYVFKEILIPRGIKVQTDFRNPKESMEATFGIQ